MNYCKTCSTTLNVRQEKLLDGTLVYYCKKCRRYFQGLLRSCETCRDGKICLRATSDRFVCDEWKDAAGRHCHGKA